MTIYLPELSRTELSFPALEHALEEPNGLLAMGGDLSADRLELAYYSGIFPWFSPGEPILWWSPDPRAIFIPSLFKPAKSLRKFFRKCNYSVSINKASSQVITMCAQVRPKEQQWIDKQMITAYSNLAKMGRCHTVEVWEDNQLIGGLYGVQVGKLFCGESMFSTKSNASKIALWLFCEHFCRYGGMLIDCQIINPHTESLGAVEISRSDYLEYLYRYRHQQVESGCFQPKWLWQNNLPNDEIK